MINGPFLLMCGGTILLIAILLLVAVRVDMPRRKEK